MPRLRRWTRIAAALALLGAAGCPGGGGGGGGDTPPGPPQVQLSIEQVFPALSFSAPVAMLQAPNDTSRWFVVEQGGVVRVFANMPAIATTSVFIDISSPTQIAFRGEAGLLGMAFHPDFPKDSRVYLFYSHDGAGGLESRLSEFSLAAGGATLDPMSEHILITIHKPEENHNGGNLAFGPDGFLYLGIGDGGGGNDLHGTIGNAQATNTLLGKMLRIDINGTTGAVRYRIPSSNPLASSGTLCNTDGTSGSTVPCAEIFALGMRNPWRWSFDRATGQLWVGDVGQNAIEEVDRVDLGGNYGWRCFEGTRSNTDVSCGVPGPFIPPVAQYGRSVGVTVTGGYVYRGTRFQGLVGRYIFADFGVGTIFSIDSTAQGTLNVTDGFMSALSISSFGQGIDGELFVVDYGGGGLYHIRQ